MPHSVLQLEQLALKASSRGAKDADDPQCRQVIPAQPTRCTVAEIAHAYLRSSAAPGSRPSSSARYDRSAGLREAPTTSINSSNAVLRQPAERPEGTSIDMNTIMK